MVKTILKLQSILLLLVLALTVNAQGYKVGDHVSDFTLKSVDDKHVSLSDYSSKKGVVVIFTCNECPYVKAYDKRIIALNKKYAPKGFPVIGINSNDATISSSDSFEAMQTKAKAHNFNYPYLHDKKQDVFKKFGAKRTPHVYVLERDGSKFKVAYIGTIDDNYKDASAVNQHYLANAIDALLNGKTPNPKFTKAIGCSIKYRK